MRRIKTPGFPGSGSRLSAPGTAERGGTLKPGDNPVIRPAAIAFSASTTHDGGSSGNFASNVTPAAESVSVSVPACRDAIGLSNECPTSKSIRRSGSCSMAKLKARAANDSLRTRPRSAIVAVLP